MAANLGDLLRSSPGAAAGGGCGGCSRAAAAATAAAARSFAAAAAAVAVRRRQRQQQRQHEAFSSSPLVANSWGSFGSGLSALVASTPIFGGERGTQRRGPLLLLLLCRRRRRRTPSSSLPNAVASVPSSSSTPSPSSSSSPSPPHLIADARSAYLRALAAVPGHVRALTGSGDLCAEAGDAAAAAEFYERAVAAAEEERGSEGEGERRRPRRNRRRRPRRFLLRPFASLLLLFSFRFPSPLGPRRGPPGPRAPPRGRGGGAEGPRLRPGCPVALSVLTLASARAATPPARRRSRPGPPPRPLLPTRPRPSTRWATRLGRPVGLRRPWRLIRLASGCSSPASGGVEVEVEVSPVSPPQLLLSLPLPLLPLRSSLSPPTPPQRPPRPASPWPTPTWRRPCAPAGDRKRPPGPSSRSRCSAPPTPAAASELGASLKDSGRHDEAAAAYRRALALLKARGCRGAPRWRTWCTRWRAWRSGAGTFSSCWRSSSGRRGRPCVERFVVVGGCVLLLPLPPLRNLSRRCSPSTPWATPSLPSWPGT